MHIAVHDSLRGDPLLGEDAQQRFLATRFNNAGQAIDAMGFLPLRSRAHTAAENSRRVFLGCRTTLFPRWRSKRRKSYFLSVLTKVLPATLYRDFGVIFQDSDPTAMPQ